jgi:hypothetical protein
LVIYTLEKNLDDRREPHDRIGCERCAALKPIVDSLSNSQHPPIVCNWISSTACAWANAAFSFSMSELPDSFVRQARLRSAVGK